jgi:hypothetical protein
MTWKNTKDKALNLFEKIDLDIKNNKFLEY